MNQYETSKLRNVALVSHSGTGKTSLAESMLWITKASKRLGKVDEGSSHLDYLEDDLTNMAKEAQQKSVGAVNYGSKQECDQILECLEKRREEIDGRSDSRDVLTMRAQLLAEHATFRRDDDAVPVPASVATVLDVNADGVVSEVDASLLGENFLGIARYLSR